MTSHHALRGGVWTVIAVLLGASAGAAATFTVINTNDSGAGSLRQAVIDANANAGADTIDFNIPGGGPFVPIADAAAPVP